MTIVTVPYFDGTENCNKLGNDRILVVPHGSPLSNRTICLNITCNVPSVHALATQCIVFNSSRVLHFLLEIHARKKVTHYAHVESCCHLNNSQNKSWRRKLVLMYIVHNPNSVYEYKRSSFDMCARCTSHKIVFHFFTSIFQFITVWRPNGLLIQRMNESFNVFQLVCLGYKFINSTVLPFVFNQAKIHRNFTITIAHPFQGWMRNCIFWRTKNPMPDLLSFDGSAK